MDQFNYIDGNLYVENVSADDIVLNHGSPVYVYSAKTLVGNFLRLKNAFSAIEPLICFSVKSCANLSILKLLVDQGSGLDVVSGGELFRALKAGAAPEKIVFAGVGKSRNEIREAIDAGVLFFNAESEGELQRLEEVAAAANKNIRVAVRVNPDVADADTPEKTSTGGRQTKFGIPLESAVALFASGRFRHINLTGIHIHLGSPIPAAQTYISAIDKIEAFMNRVEANGQQVDFINIGGGFPVAYGFEASAPIALEDMGAQICARLRELKARGKRFIIEPGRSISANSGILLTSVEYLKQGWDHKVAIVNAGMNVLLRPSLYNANHIVWPTRYQNFSGHWGELAPGRIDATDLQAMDVVGPICETGDYFALARQLPRLNNDSILAVFSCGAYGMTMASQYNSRGRPAELMVNGNEVRVIRESETYDALIEHELSGLQVSE